MSTIALTGGGPRSRVKPLLVALLLALATTVGWIGATSSPAHAATVDGCPSTYFCFYADTGLDSSKGMGKVSGNNPDYRKFSASNCPNGNWDQCISSILNNGTSCTVYIWTGFNYTGSVHSLSRGDNVPDLTEKWGTLWNNNISANHWCTSR